MRYQSRSKFYIPRNPRTDVDFYRKHWEMLDFVIFAVTFVVALLIAVIYLYPVRYYTVEAQ